MWVIDPMIEQGYQVMRAWGFTPKTVGFYWVKQNIKSEGYFTGLGYYTRANPEQCILGTRGKGLPRKDKGIKCLFVHLPYYDGQNGIPEGKAMLDLNMMVKAIEIIIKTI